MSRLPCKGLTFAVILLACTASTVAQSDEAAGAEHEVEQPASPYLCGQWEQLIQTRQASDDPLERSLGEIYGNDEFSWCQSRRVRVREERESRWNLDIPGLATLAEIARILAISGLLALVIWALWRWRRQIRRLIDRASNRRPGAVEEARRRAISQPALPPSDIGAAARELWNQGRAREAVALLYRGALAVLLAGVRSTESHTEREVQRLLRDQGLAAGTLTYMDALIQCWQRTAWADQPPGDDEFQQLLDQWLRHCQQPAQAGGTS